MDIFLRGWGPVANTASTVSAYPKDGTLVTLETSCEVLTWNYTFQAMIKVLKSNPKIEVENTLITLVIKISN